MIINGVFAMYFLFLGMLAFCFAIGYGIVKLCLLIYEQIEKKNENKIEERVDDEFYHMCMNDNLKESDKHIDNVIESCKTHEQLRNVRVWLYGYYKRMTDHYLKKGYLKESCRLFFNNSLYRKLDKIHDKHNELSENNVLK